MKTKLLRIMPVLLLFTLTSFTFLDKNPKKESIKWLTLEEAAAQIKKEPRKVVVDVYTDWCGWCKKMDKNTFTDPKVVAYVNKNFYAVKLNAESKSPITINGKTFNYNAKLRTHEAALALLNNQPGYPTTVYLDEKFQILAPVPGYLDVPTFSSILTYFNENHHTKKTFAEYTAAAKSK